MKLINAVLFSLFAAVFAAISSVAVADESDAIHQKILAEFPLHHSSFHGDLSEVERLLDNGANPNAVNDGGGTALMMGAGKGHAEVVKLLLSAGANPNFELYNSGKTALYWAVKSGHAEVVKLLLSAEANPNAANDDGETALMQAVRNGHTDAEYVKIVRMLLSAGANPNVVGSDGWAALMIAAGLGQAEVVKLLLSEGANPNVKFDNNGVTA